MIVSKLHTKGLGDAALGIRASKLEQFWDWVSLEPVGAESADTFSLLAEFPRAGDLVQSKYERDIVVPLNGPWFLELVEISTGETIATGTTGDISATAADVSTLLDRLTATRANLLDNLVNADVKISSRPAIADLLGSKVTSILQLMSTVLDGERHVVRRAAQKSFTFTFSADFPLDGTEKIYFTWKKDPLAATAVVDKLCTITDAAKRTCVVAFTAGEMTIDPGEYLGEVTIYDAAMTADTVRKPVACIIYVEQNVRA